MKTGPAKRLVLAIAALAWSWTIGGCAALKPAGPPPAWTSPQAPSADDRYFYGRGCAQPQITNLPFRQSTARERARVDLAHTLHDDLVRELGQDETAARQVVESVLPSYRIVDQYLDDQGNLCARAALERELVARAISEAAGNQEPSGR